MAGTMIAGKILAVQEETIQEDLEEILADLVVEVLIDQKKQLFLAIHVKKCVKFRSSRLLTSQFIVMIVLGKIQVKEATIPIVTLQKLTKSLILS